MVRVMKISMLAGGLVAGGVVVAVVGTGAGSAAALGASPRATQAVTTTNHRLTTQVVANRGGATTRSVQGSRKAPSRGTVSATTLVSGTAPMSGTLSDGDGDGGVGVHGFGGRGHGGGQGDIGGFGRGGGLTVTSVTGATTIAATGRGGQTVTVQVSATTAYTEAGASASLSDVKTGSIIVVQGSDASTSGTTITATGVIIVLPQVSGVVTKADASTLTVTQFNGTTRAVTVAPSTRYQRSGQSVDLAAITTGTAIVAEGTATSDGSLTAVRVTIRVPSVRGQVTAVNSGSYTVAGRFDQTASTIATTTSTTYVNADGSPALASAVTKGVFIEAEGTLSSDGKTLTAQRITVTPAGAGRDFGRHGGPGGGGPDAPDSGEGAAPSAPSTSSSTTGTASI